MSLPNNSPYDCLFDFAGFVSTVLIADNFFLAKFCDFSDWIIIEDLGYASYLSTYLTVKPKKKGETLLQIIDYFNGFSSACIFELPEEL